jgi:hypothetical protein
MPKFYIITKDGFLKKYYTGQDTTSTIPGSSLPVFTDFLRKALIFNSFLEANNKIVDKSLTNCFVIDQSGSLQTQ